MTPDNTLHDAFERTLTVAATERPDPAHYARFARPETARLLGALGLDVTYVWAEGDRMAFEHKGVRREVTDLMGGYGAGLFGHHHPGLVAAMRDALADRAPVQAQASTRAWAGKLAERLSRRIGESTGREYVVTQANSGAEAIEAALKHAEYERHMQAEQAARRYRRRMNTLLADAGPDQAAFLREVARELGRPVATAEEALLAVAEANDDARRQPPVFFALEKAFHGKTTGAAQLTYHAAYREPFGRVGVRCEFLPASDEPAWRRAVARATARTWEVACRDGRLELSEKPWVNVSAILVEPIQGEGGIHLLAPEAAAMIRTVADEAGIPVIVDEIQSGLGRTGAFLASTACGLVGDYYAFAKSLGGGLVKIAALAVDRARYQPDFGVVHTSTFAEDDMSSRVACRALALLDEEDVPARSAALGERFLSGLDRLVAAHPTVFAEARGRGLMLGLAFRSQAESPSNAIRMLSDHGYLGYAIAGYMLHEEGFRVAPTLAADLVIRLEPSAFLDPAEIDRFLAALERLAAILERGNAYRLCRYVVGLAVPGDLAPIRDYREHAPATRREKPRVAKRVAFVGHFIQAKDALLWDASLAELPEGAIEKFQLATHRIFGPSVYDQIHVTSAIGETVHLSMIGVHLTSKAIEQAMRDRDTDWIVELVEEAVAKAREAGCQVVGLGGYTSIVTDNGRRIGEGGVALTTGNSLTVGMGLQALVEGAESEGIAMSDATLAVIGAAGNIGRVYAEMMAERVPRLLLVGRETGPRLVRVAARLYEAAFARWCEGETAGLAGAVGETRAAKAMRKAPAEEKLGERLYEAIAEELGDAAPVRVTADMAALAGCRLIVAASNSAKPLIRPEHLAAGPVVICDLSVPEDVDAAVYESRPDVQVIKGGLVAIPHDPAYRVAGIPLPEGHAFACMSETLLLGLMGVRGHFSYGPVEPEKVKQAMAWAAVNGFRLGAFKTDRSY